jgi:tetratricopeptide (TPR) repeat protein
MTKTISICLFLLIFAINFPVLGEDTQGQNAHTLLQSAQKLVTAEKYKEAINQFETILKQFPDTPQIKDAIPLLADSYIKLAQPEKAEEIYLKAIEQYKDDTAYLIRIHNVLAELYISTQQPQKAIKSYYAILKIEPDYTTSLQVFEKIEKLHISREDYAEAAEIRKELLDIYPKLLEKHITDPSIDAFWRARAQIDRSNFTAENYSLIARLQEQASKKQEAFSTHRFLITSFSESPFAIKSFYSMAEHLSAQGDYNGAVLFYLNSIIRSTTPLLSFRAIGIENRKFIDTHNRERLTAAEVSETLGKIYTLLHRAAKAPRFQEITSPLLQPWEQAYHLVEQCKFIQAAAPYKEIGTNSEEPFNLLACYMTALCYTHNGNYLKTLEILQPFLGNKLAPLSKKTIRTVEHFRRLSGNWQANVTSWQQQKKEWIALRKQVLLQLNEEIFTADMFILQWILT